MSYATLLVSLGLGRSNASLLRAAVQVARRFDAAVIAVAVAEPMLVDYGGGVVSGDMVEENWESTRAATRTAEAECRSLLQPHVQSFEWRDVGDYRSMGDQIASLAGAGDLVMTGAATSRLGAGPVGVAAGDIVMQAGRPVLVVPDTAETADLERVLIGWKDTREARRAASDALPLLKKARQVTIVEIGPECELAASHRRLGDVAAWLKRHGVSSEVLAAPSDGDDQARLEAVAREMDAGVVVAGAYGHSRLHEWALGGVTRGLLLQSERCSLLSH